MRYYQCTSHALMLLALLTAPHLQANQTVNVILSSDQCRYILLDTDNGQGLVSLQEGEPPRPGDRLSGPLNVSDFAELTNVRSGETLTVWVDLVEPGSRPLTRYGQRCH